VKDGLPKCLILVSQSILNFLLEQVLFFRAADGHSIFSDLAIMAFTIRNDAFQDPTPFNYKKLGSIQSIFTTGQRPNSTAARKCDFGIFA
jgi:hypothetical protein